jgi:hypothetical protein
MSTSTPFGAQLLGQTEKTLNAILDRELAGTGLTEPEWVTLVLTVAIGEAIDRDQLIGRVAGAVKVSEEEAQTRVDKLTTAGLLQVGDGENPPVQVTDAGDQVHARIRGAITPITERLWGDLPAEDLATAGRVLNTILARANAELTGSQGRRRPRRRG